MSHPRSSLPQCVCVLFDKRDCWKSNVWYALYTLNHFTVSFLQAHSPYMRVSLIIHLVFVCAFFVVCRSFFLSLYRKTSHTIFSGASCLQVFSVSPERYCYRSFGVVKSVSPCVVSCGMQLSILFPLLDSDSTTVNALSIIFSMFQRVVSFPFHTSYCVFTGAFFFQQSTTKELCDQQC